MKPNLIDYIQVYDNFLSSDQCDHLIELYEEVARDKPDCIEHHDVGHYKFNQLNLHHSGHIETAKWYMQNFHRLSFQYFKDMGCEDYMDFKHGFEAVRIKKYNPDGSHFGPHIDAIEAENAKRFLIGLTYLTDNEEGGTNFPRLGFRSECKKGRIVLFPPTWQYYHEGESPIKEPKYIIMTSLHYLRIDE